MPTSRIMRNICSRSQQVTLFRRLISSTSCCLVGILSVSYYYIYYYNYSKQQKVEITSAATTGTTSSMRNKVFVASALSMQNESLRNTPKQSPVAAANIIRVFCYGDSLTAGTSPPSYELYPYAVHLEESINKNMDISSRKKNHPTSSSMMEQQLGGAVPKISIRWKGLPGWTAKTMLEYANDSNVGLCTTIKKVQNPSLSLVIILAGTNDLGMEVSSSSDPQEASKRIANDIIALHQLVYDSSSPNNHNIQTLAISIPPSKWQQSSNIALAMAADVNARIEAWCDATENSHFVKHPIESWSSNDLRWATDGLHFSPLGYEEFGKSLTSVVSKLLFPEIVDE